jgi:hypothetical protein
MLADMADGPLPRHDVALKLAVATVVLAAVAVVVIWDPILSLARSLDLPHPSRCRTYRTSPSD